MTADPSDTAGPPASGRNPLTLFGVALTTASAIAFIAYYVVEALGLIEGPYAGLFGFFLIPALFVLGLLLIPLGMWREARRRRRGRAPWPWPIVNFGRPATRRLAAAVGVLTLVNLAIVAVAGFGAVHYMETTEFCGQVCHEPMRPQFTSHRVGAHAHVKCVGCHVAPGAEGAVRAKLNGTRQLYEVAVGSYPRPIHAEGRVPGASETCSSCHRPGFTPRDTTRVIRDYADDEASTETVTTLDLFTTRIHWHIRPDVRIEYTVSATDPGAVTYVRATTPGGVTEYSGPNVPAAPNGPLRTMDCLDCHNRPAHTLSATAERTVDRAIAAGEIDRSLPFVRREVLAAVKAEYDSEASAVASIERRLLETYASRGRTPEVTKAIQTAQTLYRSNVFPEMKVTWGTYLPLLGHVDAPGCFRCHDDEHKAKSGAAIRQDCELCHTIR